MECNLSWKQVLEKDIGEGAETGAEVVIGEEKSGDAMSGTELGITNELE